MDLKKEISTLLNKASRENESGTPDFVLADFLMKCLEAGECMIKRRDIWLERKK